jgi:hypothetical protein
MHKRRLIALDITKGNKNLRINEKSLIINVFKKIGYNSLLKI